MLVKNKLDGDFVQSFMEFLFVKDVITLEQWDQVTNNTQSIPYRDELYYRYCYNLSLDDVKKVNEAMRLELNKSFEQVALQLRLISSFDIEINNGAEPLDELVSAQVLVSLGILPSEDVYTYLLAYKLDGVLVDGFVGELGINIEIDDPLSTFTTEYITILFNRFDKALGEHTKFEEITNPQPQEIFCPMLCYQKVFNEDGAGSFITGIIGDYESFSLFAAQLHERLTYMFDDIALFEPDPDTVNDILCEFLNNTNGMCTYKFNIEFDLDTPHCVENIEIRSQKMRLINYKFGAFSFDICIIPTDEFILEQQNNNLH